jgi:hypothetical protein
MLDAFTQTLGHLGDLLAAKQQHSDYQDDQKLGKADGS